MTFYQYSFCQNLVPNPSFENFNCGFPNFICHWFKPANDWGTPDDFDNDSTFSGNNFPCQSLQNQNIFAGSATTPFMNHFLGMLMYYPQGGQIDSRENISTKLLTTLDSGKHYLVGFHVKLGNRSKYIINNIGLKLSQDTLTCGNNHHLINTIPTVFSNSLIYDSIGWSKFEINYQAIGNERFLTIGNFFPDSNCQIQINPLNNPHDTICLLTRFGAYYLFDSIYVIENMNLENNSNLTKNDEFSIYPNPISANFFTINSSENMLSSTIELFSIAGTKLPFSKVSKSKNSASVYLHSNYKGLAIIKFITNATICRKILIL